MYLLCAMVAINVGIYFSVLTSGPMTVGVQRGTCHMCTGCRSPYVKTQKCMHKYYLDMY